jgi:hypothetical protein
MRVRLTRWRAAPQGVSNNDNDPTWLGQDLSGQDLPVSCKRASGSRWGRACCESDGAQSCDAACGQRGVWQRLVSRNSGAGSGAVQQVARAKGASEAGAAIQTSAGGPRHAPKIDQPILLVRASSATRPRWELPLASRPGDQTAMDALPGAIARMPPPTPLFPGRPTR